MYCLLDNKVGLSERLTTLFILDVPVLVIREKMGKFCAELFPDVTLRKSGEPLDTSSAPSINAKVVKLQECPEEFDMTPREAKFAIRATDLGSWNSSSRSGQGSTDWDPKTIQHWALIVYFPRGEIINLFEAFDDDGQLQAGRAQIAFKDIAVFNKADYIGTAVTSPYQLLEIAKQVKTGDYLALLGNNCQSWLKEFLDRVYSACESRLILPEKYRVKNLCHDIVSCIMPQPKSVPYEY